MGLWVLEAVLTLVILYSLLPFFLSRVAGIGVMRSVRGSTSTALTFDDGPHPIYTPLVLDVLQKHGVRATFFVMGSQAELHPELIRRMHREGHGIGVHGYRHRPHWLMSPWKVRREAQRTAEVVERLTGVRPTLLRPPWGLLNLLDFVVLREFRIVLWSGMVGDWRKQSVARLSRRLQKSLRAGAVLVLHDSDETVGAEHGAPLVMVEALEKLLRETAASGMDWVRAEELERETGVDQGSRSGKLPWVTRVWLGWEHLFQRLFHVQTLRSDRDLLFVRLCRYKGREAIELDDGTVIQRGDQLMEIHLNNEQLLALHGQANSEMQLAKLLLKEMRRALRVVASHLNHPDHEAVKALYGISLINRGIGPLGFRKISMSRGLFALATKWYLRVLLRVLHPQGRERMKIRTDALVPQQVVLSRQELFARYL
ncbi:polysaccharide deacetylase family protein [Tumebacillus sp. ITR2]|uniref:Polysaccharide deacetylase family protein n=1 Tax=Tumebacillus amylolyticus TaxID=2801339 RepID=A0ABS1JFI9_9BACL|nr:polysaccharide deacetylase family protein [Tumebacillus amylolyticus]MBL0388980.1 polysaccharide deacetylase family protein [Tumebacillus amylolyticus]